MERFQDKVSDSGMFQAFITDLNPIFTETVYSKYLTPRFNETKDWKGIEKAINMPVMASLIDEHSGKPIIGTQAPAELRGTIPHFGDKYPVSSDELQEIRRLEDFIIKNVESGNAEVADQLTDQLTEILSGRFDKLSRNPLVTIDKLLLEEWSNGTATIDSDKNLTKIPYQIDFVVKKYHVGTVWSEAANATALADLDKFVNKVWKDLKIKVNTLSLNPDEVRKLLAQTSTKNAITGYITGGSGQTKVIGIPSSENVNIVLNGQYRIPALNEVDHTIAIGDDNGNVVSQFYGFLDGRVAATIGTDLGYYMYTPAAEQWMPDQNYNYAVTEGNVLLSSRSEKGNLTLESDLSALPVLKIRKIMAILVTDDTTTGSALV